MYYSFVLESIVVVGSIQLVVACRARCVHGAIGGLNLIILRRWPRCIRNPVLRRMATNDAHAAHTVLDGSLPQAPRIERIATTLAQAVMLCIVL